MRDDARARSHWCAPLCSLLLSVLFSTGVESASASRTPRTARPWVSFELKSPSEVHTINTAPLLLIEVPAHGYVSYLEQRVGTAHVWQFVLGLHVTGNACKSHRFRESFPGVDSSFVLQLWHADKVKYQSPEHTLTVFGHVSFVEFCNEGLVLEGFLPNLCQTKALQIGNTIFTYLIADAEATNTAPRYDVLIEVPRTSCNRLVVHMGVGTQGPGAHDRHCRARPVDFITARGDTQGRPCPNLYLRLDGGPWNLDDWTTTGTRLRTTTATPIARPFGYPLIQPLVDSALRSWAGVQYAAESVLACCRIGRREGRPAWKGVFE